tara:strand:- start:27192 stop:27482 length:291 start_codon:yes stop_codon:yes gene_type:complete
MDVNKRLQRVIKDLDKIKQEVADFNFAIAFTTGAVDLEDEELNELEEEDFEIGICSIVDRGIGDYVFYEMIYGLIDTKNEIDGRSSTDIDNFLNNN